MEERCFEKDVLAIFVKKTLPKFIIFPEKKMFQKDLLPYMAVSDIFLVKREIIQAKYFASKVLNIFFETSF